MTNMRLLLVIAALTIGVGMAQVATPASPSITPSLRSLERPQAGLYLDAARYLGVTPQELVMLGRGGKTLAEIAKELGADSAKLETTLVEARNRAIDEAMQRKTLTGEEASRFKAVSPAVVRAVLNRPVGMQPVEEAMVSPLRTRWSFTLPSTMRPLNLERQGGSWWVW